MKKQGFTLIELMITVAIIAVIASVVIGNINKAKEAQNKTNNSGLIENQPVVKVDVLVQTDGQQKVVYKTQLYNQNQQKESWIYLGNGNWKQVDQETYENAEIGGPIP